MKNDFPIVGVMGAGPLARMLVPPATDMGVELLFYAGDPGESAAQIGDHVIGDIRDMSALRDFADRCDIVIFEGDVIPISVVRTLEVQGVATRPSSAVYEFVLNRNEMLKGNPDPIPDDFWISVLVARSPHGQGCAWAPTNLALNENSLLTITPAPELTEILSIRAQEIALALAEESGLVGVMSIEFTLREYDLRVRFLNLNPNLAGNWTIEGSRTSQFEQHLRAILDLPLGNPVMTGPYAVTGTYSPGIKRNMYRPYLHLMARSPAMKFHQYRNDDAGAAPIGHVTAVGGNLLDLEECITHAVDYMSGAIDE